MINDLNFIIYGQASFKNKFPFYKSYKKKENEEIYLERPKAWEGGGGQGD